MENTGIYAVDTVKGVSEWRSKLQGNSAMGIWIASFPGNRWNKRIIKKKKKNNQFLQYVNLLRSLSD